jgi:hypothetical protein
MTHKNLPVTRAIPAQATSHVTAPTAPPDDADPLLGFTPYLHEAPRRNSITPERQRRFIAQLAATGIVRQAARHIGASLEALYKLRSRPGAEGFAQAWDMAVDAGVRRLEDGALARAIEGEERLVVSAGQVVGTERRHNEALVMFFLRQRRGERYTGDIRPGHPLYDRIRAEVLAEIGDTLRQHQEEEARIARDRKRIREEVREEEARRIEAIHAGYAEEEERERAAALAARTPDERRRDEIIDWLAHMDLARLEDMLGIAED